VPSILKLNHFTNTHSCARHIKLAALTNTWNTVMSDISRAALWMTGAIISFTSMAIAGRAVSVELDTFEIMLFRSVTGIVVVLTIATIAGTLSQLNCQQFSLHVKRNLAHFIGQNLWFFALPLISLTQLFALEFTSPIWVILLAPFLLGERFSYISVLAATFGFMGVMIVTQPFQTEISIGTFAAACAAISFAFTAIFTRKLTRTQSITCIMFWLTVMQAAFGLIGAGCDGNIALPSAIVLPWVILIGFAGLLAHFCLTKALSLAPINIVMPIDFIRLPVIAIVAAQIYDEQLDPWVFVGAVIIFGANYLNIWFGQKPSRPNDI
jgi:drug/metabolite transporter (DMT)-like permease